MILGFENLTEVQQEILLRVSRRHIACVGGEYKKDYEPVETWFNDGVCVRLRNGEWYHYMANGTWY